MKAQKSAIVILGASGDLAKRKLLPALNKLYQNGSIASDSIVVGSGRTEFTKEQFRDRFDNLSPEFKDQLFYHQGIEGLKKYIDEIGEFERVVVFFSLPPSVYGKTSKQLCDEGFCKKVTLIIEKPFGYDFESARHLNNELKKYYREDQIFRIDHYLAKEAVQNILVFRFANSLFESIWNNNFIESIQIEAFEKIGVEDRGAYFDGAGIIRDMVQNHLSQLLSLITMEPPVTLEADDIRMQKINILKCLEVKNWVKYQYHGYHKEKGVASDSSTETFAEMQLAINNFRWYGVPIFVRTGKYLPHKGTSIGIRLKRMPNLLFNHAGRIASNKIIFRIQPESGINVDLATKIPGTNFNITHTNMAFSYRDVFSQEVPEAYQKLLLDALNGDASLFVSDEETEISWKKFDKVIADTTYSTYEPGTMPPPQFYNEYIDFSHYTKDTKEGK